MHRHEALGVNARAISALVIRIVEHKLAALLLERAADDDALASLNAQAGDAMPQPGGVGDAATIADGRLEAFEAARQIVNLEALECAVDRALGLKKQATDRRDGWKRLVASGEVKEQVADGPDVEAREEPRADRSDALQRLDR